MKHINIFKLKDSTAFASLFPPFLFFLRRWEWCLWFGKVSLQKGEEGEGWEEVCPGAAQESQEGREDQVWGKKCVISMDE